MQRAMNVADFVRQENPLKTSFNVVLVYEDFETGKQAKKTYDFLAQNLSREFVLSHQMWKFDVLTIPKLAQIASQDVLEADILIVSCRGGESLPEHMRKWMEDWVQLGARAQALVALFGESDSYGRNGIGAYLSGVARRAGMEFFQQPGCETPGGVAIASRAHPDVQQTRAVGMFAGAVAQVHPAPRWGINE